MRASALSAGFSPLEAPTPVNNNTSDLIKIDPHKYLIFNYSKESEEWVSIVTLWNNDNENSYIFNIDYNKIGDKECFIIRPRKEGHLLKQTGFGRKIVLKITYDPRNDEPSIRHSKEKLGSEKRAEERMQCFSRFEPLKDTRRYFKLQIWKVQVGGRGHPLFFRCQYLLPIFFHSQHSNTEVFVYPPKSITFNRNQGNQFSYWKSNFFIINNASQSVYFKVLTTRLPNNCDMVIFPTSGVVQHSFSDYTMQKKHLTKPAAQLETDQEMSGKHYTIVSILLLDPEKAYMTHMAQKPIATIVMLYSYQKHPETDNLDELLQWASGKETIEIFVRDMSHNVGAKNTVVHDKAMLEMAMHNSMDQVYKLENATCQSTGQQTRTNATSQKTSRAITFGQSSFFGISPLGLNAGSAVISPQGGGIKDLISHSSVPLRECESMIVQVPLSDKIDKLSDILNEKTQLPLPLTKQEQSSTDLSFPRSTGSSTNSMLLQEAIKQVKDKVASQEDRISVTYGVSDDDIRTLIQHLQQKGCNASKPDNPN